MKKADICFTIFFMLVGAFSFIVGQNYAYSSANGVGPGFFPLWSSGILFIASAINLALIFIRSRGKEPVPFFKSKEGPRRFLIFLGSVVVFVIGIIVIGILPATAIFMFLTYRYFDKLSWKASIFPTIGTIIFIYLFFIQLLKLKLPMGSIWH
ncbi:MAG: tripartite tricarboxylate transporter TctB family protein [Acetivibrionales bacterium]|jgi:putative tricarboxylic transport membrane protein